MSAFENLNSLLCDVLLVLTLVSVCSLYLNSLSDVGKQSLHVRGVPRSHGGSGRRVKVLASVTEGSDLSEDWHPILSVIRENASSWDRERVKQQLLVRAERKGSLSLGLSLTLCLSLSVCLFPVCRCSSGTLSGADSSSRVC